MNTSSPHSAASDNEYDQAPTHSEYFEELEAQYRKGGIVVPL